MRIQKLLNKFDFVTLNNDGLCIFKITNLKAFLLLLFTFLGINLKAQWMPPCQDSLRKNLYYQCNEPAFKPVCGCNNKTYRNECVSYNVYGINVIKSEGVCKDQNFEFDFYPNPAIENINFGLEFFDKGNITVQILDNYGKLMYFSHKTGIHRFDDVINVGGFKTGLYIIIAMSGTSFKVKKLVIR